MRSADTSRVSSFLRQVVVASVILPSDVVFFFHSFFRPRSLPGFLAGIPRVDGACEEDDEDETGRAEGVWGWCSGLFSFLLSSIYLSLYAGISTWHVSCEKNSVDSINKHGKV